MSTTYAADLLMAQSSHDGDHTSNEVVEAAADEGIPLDDAEEASGGSGVGELSAGMAEEATQPEEEPVASREAEGGEAEGGKADALAGEHSVDVEQPAEAEGGALEGNDAAAQPTSTVEKSWHERNRERKAQLDALRRKEQTELDDTQKRGAKERLAYLMRQTDVFAHFIRPSDMAAAGSSEGTRKGGAGRKGKGRMSEKQEDDILMQEADKEVEKAGTRLTKQPACIKSGEMRSYQLEGLNWLIKLYEHGINGILADEMGLGKTLQTISILGYLKESCNVPGPHIVITPKSTLGNWYKEVDKWCPSLRAFKLHGSKPERAALREKYLEAPGCFDVCITTYEVAISEASALKKFVWRYLVIDEAHRIKNEESVLSKVVREFKSHFRLLITGTPLQNNLHELWSMLNFLLPDVFANAQHFDDWFDLTAGQPDDALQQLHKILRPFLLRRLKADVEKTLPPKREIKLLIGMTEKQQEFYKSILEKNLEVLNSFASKTSKTQLQNIVMQLRKCANHPYLFEGFEEPPFVNDERLIQTSGKMLLLDKLLQRLHKQGHRVLLFSQMTRFLDILEDYAVFRGWEYCRIDGSTPGEARDEAMHLFNAPGSSKFLFMLSTRAGGLGINLATADTVILYDSDWNPQADLQAMDRAHRIGQKREVMVYRFMIQGSVEEKIIERAQRKLYLDAAVIQQGRLAENSKALSKEEMLSMIRFGADEVLQLDHAEATEEDLDALLARGEERTATDNARFKSQVNSLANFTLDGQEKSLYDYEDQDWKQRSSSKGPFAVKLKKRTQKRDYDENEYYRNMLNKSSAEGRAARAPKQVQIHDFQFYDTETLPKLRDKEASYLQWKQERMLQRRARGDEDEDEAALRRAASLERVEQLSEEEEAEMAALMEQGFRDWRQKDFKLFVDSCERNGRHNLDAVALPFSLESKYDRPKSAREVSRYASVFFERWHELKNSEAVMRRIEAGEERLRRTDRIVRVLSKKVSLERNPWVALKIEYGPSGRGKHFSEDNDRFLVCMINQLGYGNWDALRDEVRASWLLRFDWFIKTRTAQELQRRVDALAKLIEREVEVIEAAEAAEEQQRKRAAARQLSAKSTPKRARVQ